MSAGFELRVRYFASIREALGRGDETVLTRATTLGELRDELIARGGAYAEVLARQRPVRLAPFPRPVGPQPVAPENPGQADQPDRDVGKTEPRARSG